ERRRQPRIRDLRPERPDRHAGPGDARFHQSAALYVHRSRQVPGDVPRILRPGASRHGDRIRGGRGGQRRQTMSAAQNAGALYPANEVLTRGERVVLNLYVISALLVFVLMMLLGLTMRTSQSTWMNV